MRRDSRLLSGAINIAVEWEKGYINSTKDDYILCLLPGIERLSDLLSHVNSLLPDPMLGQRSWSSACLDRVQYSHYVQSMHVLDLRTRVMMTSLAKDHIRGKLPEWYSKFGTNLTPQPWGRNPLLRATALIFLSANRHSVLSFA